MWFVRRPIGTARPRSRRRRPAVRRRGRSGRRVRDPRCARPSHAAPDDHLRCRSTPPCGAAPRACHRVAPVVGRKSPVQLSVRVVAPPCSRVEPSPSSCQPPQTIISVPVHTAVCRLAAVGHARPRWRSAAQLSVDRVVPPADEVGESRPAVSRRPRRSSPCRSTPPCDEVAPSAARVAPSTSRPAVGGRVVAAAGVQLVGARSRPAPDDHLRAGPDRRVSRAAPPARFAVDVGVQLSPGRSAPPP